MPAWSTPRRRAFCGWCSAATSESASSGVELRVPRLELALGLTSTWRHCATAVLILSILQNLSHDTPRRLARAWSFEYDSIDGGATSMFA